MAARSSGSRALAGGVNFLNAPSFTISSSNSDRYWGQVSIAIGAPSSRSRSTTASASALLTCAVTIRAPVSLES